MKRIIFMTETVTPTELSRTPNVRRVYGVGILPQQRIYNALWWQRFDPGHSHEFDEMWIAFCKDEDVYKAAYLPSYLSIDVLPKSTVLTLKSTGAGLIATVCLPTVPKSDRLFLVVKDDEWAIYQGGPYATTIEPRGDIIRAEGLISVREAENLGIEYVRVDKFLLNYHPEPKHGDPILESHKLEEIQTLRKKLDLHNTEYYYDVYVKRRGKRHMVGVMRKVTHKKGSHKQTFEFMPASNVRTRRIMN